MKANEILKLLKISRVTLCHYVKEGKVKVTKMPNGRYDYDSDSVYSLMGIQKRDTVIYARVSTSSQKSSLNNQIDNIKAYANANGYNVTKVYSDIASGMNFDRGDFKTMIHEVINHRIKNIIISNKDRFSRISFDIWNQLCSEFDCNIIVMNHDDEDDDRGIFSDIISLIHCFSMKMYSNRRKKKLLYIEDTLTIDE